MPNAQINPVLPKAEEAKIEKYIYVANVIKSWRAVAGLENEKFHTFVKEQREKGNIIDGQDRLFVLATMKFGFEKAKELVETKGPSWIYLPELKDFKDNHHKLTVMSFEEAAHFIDRDAGVGVSKYLDPNGEYWQIPVAYILSETPEYKLEGFDAYAAGKMMGSHVKMADSREATINVIADSMVVAQKNFTKRFVVAPDGEKGAIITAEEWNRIMDRKIDKRTEITEPEFKEFLVKWIGRQLGKIEKKNPDIINDSEIGTKLAMLFKIGKYDGVKILKADISDFVSVTQTVSQQKIVEQKLGKVAAVPLEEIPEIAQPEIEFKEAEPSTKEEKATIPASAIVELPPEKERHRTLEEREYAGEKTEPERVFSQREKIYMEKLDELAPFNLASLAEYSDITSLTDEQRSRFGFEFIDLGENVNYTYNLDNPATYPLGAKDELYQKYLAIKDSAKTYNKDVEIVNAMVKTFNQNPTTKGYDELSEKVDALKGRQAALAKSKNGIACALMNISHLGSDGVFDSPELIAIKKISDEIDNQMKGADREELALLVSIKQTLEGKKKLYDILQETRIQAKRYDKEGLFDAGKIEKSFKELKDISENPEKSGIVKDSEFHKKLVELVETLEDIKKNGITPNFIAAMSEGLSGLMVAYPVNAVFQRRYTPGHTWDRKEEVFVANPKRDRYEMSVVITAGERKSKIGLTTINFRQKTMGATEQYAGYMTYLREDGKAGGIKAIGFGAESAGIAKAGETPSLADGLTVFYVKLRGKDDKWQFSFVDREKPPYKLERDSLMGKTVTVGAVPEWGSIMASANRWSDISFDYRLEMRLKAVQSKSRSTNEFMEQLSAREYGKAGRYILECKDTNVLSDCLLQLKALQIDATLVEEMFLNEKNGKEEKGKFNKALYALYDDTTARMKAIKEGQAEGRKTTNEVTDDVQAIGDEIWEHLTQNQLSDAKQRLKLKDEIEKNIDKLMTIPEMEELGSYYEQYEDKTDLLVPRLKALQAATKHLKEAFESMRRDDGSLTQQFYDELRLTVNDIYATAAEYKDLPLADWFVRQTSENFRTEAEKTKDTTKYEEQIVWNDDIYSIFELANKVWYERLQKDGAPTDDYLRLVQYPFYRNENGVIAPAYETDPVTGNAVFDEFGSPKLLPGIPQEKIVYGGIVNFLNNDILNFSTQEAFSTLVTKKEVLKEALEVDKIGAPELSIEERPVELDWESTDEIFNRNAPLPDVGLTPQQITAMNRPAVIKYLREKVEEVLFTDGSGLDVKKLEERDYRWMLYLSGYSQNSPRGNRFTSSGGQVKAIVAMHELEKLAAWTFESKKQLTYGDIKAGDKEKGIVGIEEICNRASLSGASGIWTFTEKVKEYLKKNKLNIDDDARNQINQLILALDTKANGQASVDEASRLMPLLSTPANYDIKMQYSQVPRGPRFEHVYFKTVYGDFWLRLLEYNKQEILRQPNGEVKYKTYLSAILQLSELQLKARYENLVEGGKTKRERLELIGELYDKDQTKAFRVSGFQFSMAEDNLNSISREVYGAGVLGTVNVPRFAKGPWALIHLWSKDGESQWIVDYKASKSNSIEALNRFYLNAFKLPAGANLEGTRVDQEINGVAYKIILRYARVEQTSNPKMPRPRLFFDLQTEKDTRGRTIDRVAVYTPSKKYSLEARRTKDPITDREMRELRGSISFLKDVSGVTVAVRSSGFLKREIRKSTERDSLNLRLEAAFAKDKYSWGLTGRAQKQLGMDLTRSEFSMYLRTPKAVQYEFGKDMGIYSDKWFIGASTYDSVHEGSGARLWYETRVTDIRSIYVPEMMGLDVNLKKSVGDGEYSLNFSLGAEKGKPIFGKDKGAGVAGFTLQSKGFEK